jgi:hypothetical protein
VSSSWARQHQTWAHLKRAGRGQHRPSSIHPPLQVTCASFLRQVHRRMHHLQTRSVATTAQHLTDAHHSDRLPQAAVARPSGGGGVGGHVAGCDRQTVVHDFDFHVHRPPWGGGATQCAYVILGINEPRFMLDFKSCPFFAIHGFRKVGRDSRVARRVPCGADCGGQEDFT